MLIHGIFSSYFGDDEFDVGKAIRRNSQFFDTEYVMDFSDGHRTRAYIVDWARTFADLKAGYYQEQPMFFEPGGAELWRRTSFEKADKAWSYADDDWVCFVDCTEGVSIDESLGFLPDDRADVNIFRNWMVAEIDAASGDQISLPVYAFIGNSPPWMNHVVMDPVLQSTIDTMTDDDIYLSMSKFELNKANHAVVQECYENWTRAGWSPRLFRVSALKDVDFDWSSIDTFTATAPSDVASFGSAIVSYAYARWAHDPARIDRTTQRPMTEADDDGWRIRQLLSRVRPVPGLPFDDWDNADVVGRTLPQGVVPEITEPVVKQFNDDFSHAFTNFDAELPDTGPSWGTWDPLMVMYPNIVRMNRRESLYFLEEQLGPVPWNFYTGQPNLTPAQQYQRLTQEPYVQPQPMLWSQIIGLSTVVTVSTTIEHPYDTIRPEEEGPPPSERPPWNTGQWNKGIW